MNVTDVVVRQIVDNNGLQAIVSVTLDNEIVIHDVRIMEKENKLYLLYPNSRYKDKKRGLVYPINREARQKIEQAVLEEYNNAMHRLDEKRN